MIGSGIGVFGDAAASPPTPWMDGTCPAMTRLDRIAAIVPPMRVLAIDTALEACAAAVLDTEHGKVASESLPMLRGHAEALMPLIAPRHEQADMRVLRARPHRRHHRPRQLHRPAGRHRGGARHRARRGQARHRPDHARRLCRALYRPRRQDRGRGRDRRAPPARLSAGFRAGRAHAGRAAHRQRRRCGARRRQRPGPDRRHRRQHAGGGVAGARAAAGAGRRPARAGHRLGRRGSRSPPTKAPASRSRSICARPTRSRRTPRGCRADDRDAHAAVRARRAGAVGGKRRATPRPSPRCTPLRSATAGATASSSGCCSSATSSRTAPRAGARCTASSCRGSPPAKRKSFRSRSHRRAAAAGSRARCSTCICGGWPDLARARCSSKSTRTTSRRGGSTSGPASARSGGGRAITSRAATMPRPRWCCAAIWCESALRWTAFASPSSYDRASRGTCDRAKNQHRGPLHVARACA